MTKQSEPEREWCHDSIALLTAARVASRVSFLTAIGPVACGHLHGRATCRTACTTNGFGNQTATYSATITDSVDPAAVGQSVTYRFVVPFAQDPPPVTATYKGGTVRYPIPAGLTVTAVSTPPKAGSNLTRRRRCKAGASS